MDTTVTIEFTSDTEQHLKTLEHQLRHIHDVRVDLVEPKDPVAPALIAIAITKGGERAESAAQNLEFSKSRLTMPTLALGGEAAAGDSLRQSMEALAVSVEGGVLPDCGHFMMEEQPEALAEELLRFFALVERA